MKAFKGRVAVVTGAAEGIGRALANRAAREGMKVVLADIQAETLERAAKDLRAEGAEALAVMTDVSQAASVEELASRTLSAFGGVHLLCNNAGVGTLKPVWESTLRDWQWVLGVDLWGVAHGVRVFTPIMMKQGTEGHIVNTSSTLALAPAPGTGIYNMAKAGVIALSETLYLELRENRSPLGVSVLCPGPVRTSLAPDRHRPTELLNPAEPPLPPERERWRHDLMDTLKQGMAPEAVADVVFRGIAEEKFYIFTHDDSIPPIRRRMETLLQGANPKNPFQATQ